MKSLLPSLEFVNLTDAELRELITRANDELARRHVERWRKEQLAGPKKEMP